MLGSFWVLWTGSLSQTPGAVDEKDFEVHGYWSFSQWCRYGCGGGTEWSRRYKPWKQNLRWKKSRNIILNSEENSVMFENKWTRKTRNHIYIYYLFILTKILPVPARIRDNDIVVLIDPNHGSRCSEALQFNTIQTFARANLYELSCWRTWRTKIYMVNVTQVDTRN